MRSAHPPGTRRERSRVVLGPCRRVIGAPRMTKRVWLISIVCLLIVAVRVHASSPDGSGTDAGTIRGVALNDAGTAVSQASIVVLNQNGIQTSTLSDAAGRYELAATVSGNVTVTISAPGFADFTRRLTVRGGATTTINARLRVSVHETVQVASKFVEMSLASSQNLSTVTISGENLKALPEDPDALL